MKTKRLTALLFSSVMAVSILAGCGSIDKNEVVATFDDTEVSLGLANFIVKLEQAGVDDTYQSYFGDSAWSTDLYGNGTTLEQSLKDGIMESLQEIYALEQHMEEYGVALTEEESAAISAAAAQFIADNDKKALDALGADTATVEEYLRLSTIRSKMHDAVAVGVDTEVSDEEANTSAYSYVTITKSSSASDADSVEADLEALEVKAADFAEEAKAGTLEEAAETYGYTVLKGTFTADDDSLNEDVLAELKSLKEGEVSGLIDGDSSYYVVRLDAETDAQATEATKESIIEERKEDLYNETVEGWKEEHQWTVKDKVWSKVTIENRFTTIVESTETESADAEAVVDTTEE